MKAPGSSRPVWRGAVAGLAMLALPVAAMEIGNNFWFARPGDPKTYPFVDGARFAHYPNHGEIWRQVVFDDMAPFGLVRFMDWQGTNANDTVRWADRKQPTNPDQSVPWMRPHQVGGVPVADPPDWTGAGMALEYLIEFANRAQKDAWFCVPHKADDDYVRQMARLVRDQLDPQLKVYLEYSNEVWNWLFDAYHYAAARGSELNLGTTPYENVVAFYGRRAAGIHRIWTEEFAGQIHRLVRVIAFRSNSDTAPGDRLMAAYESSGGEADAFAVAPYFRGTTIEEMHASIDALAIRLDPWKAWADKRRLAFITYEGGQHVTTEAQLINADPRMYDVYRHYLDVMARYFDLFVHYAMATAWTSRNAFGLKDGFGEPEATAHKYRAVKDWIAKRQRSLADPDPVVAEPVGEEDLEGG